MLKITTQSEATLTKLVLEGRLAGPWVDELDRCWREVAGTQQNHVAVDLTGVTFIDPEGKALLTRMWQQGAKFHAVGCLTKCIVEDVTKSGRPGSSRSSRKDNNKRSQDPHALVGRIHDRHLPAPAGGVAGDGPC